MSELEDKLKGLKDNSLVKSMLGFDISDLPRLLTDHVLEKIQSPPVGNEDAIAEKFFAKAAPYFAQQITEAIQQAETRIALKVAEITPVLEKTIARLKALEAGGTGGGQFDTQAIIQGVITALQPDIVRAAQGASQATMEANFKGLQAAIYAELDKRTASILCQPPVAGVAPAGGSRLDKILGNDELVGKIIEKILGGDSNKNALAEVLKSYMLGFDHGTKVKVGTMTTDQAFSSVSEIIKGAAGK